MIRKQLYITPSQERRLRDLSARWQCTEAEIVRTALDRLLDSAETAADRLARAGLLAQPLDTAEVPSAGEIEAIERQYEAWARTRTEPIGLSQAVLDDRR